MTQYLDSAVDEFNTSLKDSGASVEWATRASTALQCRIEARALQEEPEA